MTISQVAWKYPPSTNTDFNDFPIDIRGITCLPEFNRKQRRAMGQGKLKLIKKAK